ncbi:MAG: glycosyltransferase [Deltaproteobacteria bacterium]|nr:glycosyltransferase [Deltaproteobacteria bacterium]
MTGRASWPLVSVLINCRNGAPYLWEAIESVRAQTFTDWEIIFWDNLSTDGSDVIAKAQGPRVRYFCSEVPLPLGAARNEAIEQARGEYIAFLDVDDTWRQDKLERQIPLFANPEVGLVYSNCYYMNAQGRAFSDYFSKYEPARGRPLRELIRANFIPMPTVMLRTETLRRCGGFDPELTIVEEYDLFLRVAREYQIDFVPALLASYRVHSSNASRDFRRHYAETLAVYRRCFANGSSDGGVGEDLRRAQCAVALMWAGRELFESGNITLARRRLGEAMALAGKPSRLGRSVALVTSKVVHGLKLRGRQRLIA